MGLKNTNPNGCTVVINNLRSLKNVPNSPSVHQRKPNPSTKEKWFVGFVFRTKTTIASNMFFESRFSNPIYNLIYTTHCNWSGDVEFNWLEYDGHTILI